MQVLTAGTDEYKQAVIDAIKTMDGVKGITGSYSFDSDNNPIKSVAIIGADRRRRSLQGNVLIS